ncbi:MAG: hypothetical protein HY738_18755, partial [Bacteroidia bacterium]|nr:hypothetical protein [Bacteroidia bacterium]
SEITLTKGFWAKKGSHFTAKYDDCENYYTTNSGEVMNKSLKMPIENDKEDEKPVKDGTIPLVYNKGENENTLVITFTQKPGVFTDIEVWNDNKKQVYAVSHSFERKFTLDFNNLQPGEYTIIARRDGKTFKTSTLYLPNFEKYIQSQYTYNNK